MNRVSSFSSWTEAGPNVRRFPRFAIRENAPWPPPWTSLWEGRKTTLLLESGRDGRYSVAVLEASHQLTGTAQGLRITTLEPGLAESRPPLPGPLFPALRDWLKHSPALALPAHLPPCSGGLFGFISYDQGRELEKLPELAEDDLGLPRVLLLAASLLQVYDHLEHSLTTVSWSQLPAQKTLAGMRQAWKEAGQRIDQAVEQWNQSQEKKTFPRINPTSVNPGQATRWSLSREDFIRAVGRIQSWIASGDTYQVNLSLRESRPLTVSPEAVYEALRRINPSPYMGLLRLPDWTLVCGSPELLLKRRGDLLETRPIAGTRPRGQEGVTNDAALAHELVINPKEKAEHLMLVDLLRNDLGRVSTYGTVRVPEFMTVEKYSHVQHIVSLVQGRLKPELDSWDALAAVFPGGTITGAPKIRTMEIIETLEPVQRGTYTGSLGWIDAAGENMEWNIIIRSLLAKDGWAHVQAGAGIVADSDPEKEFLESLQKAKALWQAVAEAEAENPD